MSRLQGLVQYCYLIDRYSFKYHKIMLSARNQWQDVLILILFERNISFVLTCSRIRNFSKYFIKQQHDLGLPNGRSSTGFDEYLLEVASSAFDSGRNSLHHIKKLLKGPAAGKHVILRCGLKTSSFHCLWQLWFVPD